MLYIITNIYIIWYKWYININVCKSIKDAVKSSTASEVDNRQTVGKLYIS